MPREHEIFLPLPVPWERLPETSEVRSTWIGSSILALRDRGHYDAYVSCLPAGMRETILSSVAGCWLPIELAMAHYEACDALHLPKEEVHGIGATVTRRVHGSSMALAVRLARQSGVTPWSILSQIDRLWDRIWKGGGVTVTKLGPKEARLEIARWTCARIPYTHTAMPAVVQAVTELFCQKAYIHDLPTRRADSIVMKIAWA